MEARWLARARASTHACPLFPFRIVAIVVHREWTLESRYLFCCIEATVPFPRRDPLSSRKFDEDLVRYTGLGLRPTSYLTVSRHAAAAFGLCCTIVRCFRDLTRLTMFRAKSCTRDQDGNRRYAAEFYCL